MQNQICLSWALCSFFTSVSNQGLFTTVHTEFTPQLREEPGSTDLLQPLLSPPVGCAHLEQPVPPAAPSLGVVLTPAWRRSSRLPCRRRGRCRCWRTRSRWWACSLQGSEGRKREGMPIRTRHSSQGVRGKGLSCSSWGLNNLLSKSRASLCRAGRAGRLQNMQVTPMLKKREKAAALLLSGSVPG